MEQVAVPKALRDRLSALLAACCLALLLPLFGCGGGGTNFTPKPGPSVSAQSPAPAGDITEIVVGAGDKQAQAARAIVLDTLPAGFLPGGKRVTMTTLPREMAAQVYRDRTGSAMPEGIAGWFLKRDGKSDPSIVIVGDGWGDYLKTISIHEWGHFVQLDNCTEAEFTAWRVAYNSAKARGALPTTYAETNEYEGFAEAVARIYTAQPLDPELRSVVDAVLARMVVDKGTRARSAEADQAGRHHAADDFPGCGITSLN